MNDAFSRIYNTYYSIFEVPYYNMDRNMELVASKVKSSA